MWKEASIRPRGNPRETLFSSDATASAIGASIRPRGNPRETRLSSRSKRCRRRVASIRPRGNPRETPPSLPQSRRHRRRLQFGHAGTRGRHPSKAAEPGAVAQASIRPRGNPRETHRNYFVRYWTITTLPIRPRGNPQETLPCPPVSCAGQGASIRPRGNPRETQMLLIGEEDQRRKLQFGHAGTRGRHAVGILLFLFSHQKLQFGHAGTRGRHRRTEAHISDA